MLDFALNFCLHFEAGLLDALLVGPSPLTNGERVWARQHPEFQHAHRQREVTAGILIARFCLVRGVTPENIDLASNLLQALPGATTEEFRTGALWVAGAAAGTAGALASLQLAPRPANVYAWCVRSFLTPDRVASPAELDGLAI